MKPTKALLALLCALIMLAAACGGSGGDGDTASGAGGGDSTEEAPADVTEEAPADVTEEAPADVTEEAPADVTEEEADGEETDGEETDGAEGDGAVVVRPGESGSFVTPSGNISCLIDENRGVSCHVLEHDWVIDAPTDAECDLDWGDNVSLTADGVEYGCYSDVYWDLDAEVLPYGSTIEVNGFDCQSEPTGLTCFNGVDDGFTITRAELEISQHNS